MIKKIAVIGATGLVGRQMLDALFNYSALTIIPAASAKSVGKEIRFAGIECRTVVSVEDALAQKPDIALFSAGSEVSRQYAPQFAAAGCTVIDNSSCWRMDSNVPLVIPEVNIDAIRPEHYIIANPNCSTIQMVLALSRLHRRYRIKRIVVSTYQSVTGTGMRAVKQLESEENYFAHSIVKCRNVKKALLELPERGYDPVYPHQILRNLFPHGGDFLPNGSTTEEQKLVDETRKILGDTEIQVTATVVRVPVTGGHSEAVNVEFYEEFDLEEVRQLIADTPGVMVLDKPEKNLYPTPLEAEGKNDVFVGRIRRDLSQPRTLNLWVVSDNLRKGAAVNAVQIIDKMDKSRFKNRNNS